MKLEGKDKSILFNSTDLPDIFFTEYLSQASGDFIKIYLCIVFLAKYNKDIKINDLSKKLNLSFDTIQRGLAYWEEQGTITKKLNGYIINNLQEIELHKLYSPNVTLSAEAIEQNESSQYRAKAIECINNSCFQGIMSPAWYGDIDLWFKNYGFDEQVMIALFEYCLSKSALNRKYVQAVAENWHKSNVKTYDDLEVYQQKFEHLNKLKTSIRKKLGRYNPLNQYEEAYVEKWYVDFGYDMNIINLALKRTTSKANASFDYLDKILSDWNDRNLTTATEVEAFIAEHKKQAKSIKELAKKTNYNNYEQRNYSNLDNLYANTNN